AEAEQGVELVPKPNGREPPQPGRHEGHSRKQNGEHSAAVEVGVPGRPPPPDDREREDRVDILSSAPPAPIGRSPRLGTAEAASSGPGSYGASKGLPHTRGPAPDTRRHVRHPRGGSFGHPTGMHRPAPRSPRH